MNDRQVIDLKPRLGGFLWAYIIFSIPGFISGIIGFVLIIFLTLSILSGIGAASESANSSALTYESLTSTEKTKNGILVYDLKGPIDTGDSTITGASRNTGIYTDLVAKDFKEIKNNKDIKNVVFRVNTPGGTIFASEVLGDLISDLIKDKGQTQPIFYFDQLAASGGLLASYKNSNNYIVGSPYGETGSIGVILTLPNFKGLADKVGYSETVIKSSSSKDIGSPLRDLTPEEKAYFQKQVDSSYDKFVNTVATGRKISKDKVKPIANGFVYDNKEALGYGLIDEIGDLNKAIEKASSNAGLGNDYNVWQVKSESGFLSGLLGDSQVGNMFGISKNTAKAFDRATFFKAGTVYLIDENKI